MNIRVNQLAKAPILGTVKTRMTPYLSDASALELHKALTHHVVQCFSAHPGFSLEIWGTEAHDFFTDLCGQHSLDFKRQQGRDLGERLAHCVATSLGEADAVVLVGSDCPFFSPDYLAAVSAALGDPSVDVVIGPANDGGYVLIALKSCQPTLFSNIAWGTERVLEQTLRAAEARQLRVHMLVPLDDVDRPQDLQQLAVKTPSFERFLP